MAGPVRGAFVGGFLALYDEEPSDSALRLPQAVVAEELARLGEGGGRLRLNINHDEDATVGACSLFPLARGLFCFGEVTSESFLRIAEDAAARCKMVLAGPRNGLRPDPLLEYLSTGYPGLSLSSRAVAAAVAAASSAAGGEEEEKEKAADGEREGEKKKEGEEGDGGAFFRHVALCGVGRRRGTLGVYGRDVGWVLDRFDIISDAEREGLRDAVTAAVLANRGASAGLDPFRSDSLGLLAHSVDISYVRERFPKLEYDKKILKRGRDTYVKASEQPAAPSAAGARPPSPPPRNIKDGTAAPRRAEEPAPRAPAGIPRRAAMAQAPAAVPSPASAATAGVVGQPGGAGAPVSFPGDCVYLPKDAFFSLLTLNRPAGVAGGGPAASVVPVANAGVGGVLGGGDGQAYRQPPLPQYQQQQLYPGYLPQAAPVATALPHGAGAVPADRGAPQSSPFFGGGGGEPPSFADARCYGPPPARFVPPPPQFSFGGVAGDDFASWRGYRPSSSSSPFPGGDGGFDRYRDRRPSGSGAGAGGGRPELYAREDQQQQPQRYRERPYGGWRDPGAVFPPGGGGGYRNGYDCPAYPGTSCENPNYRGGEEAMAVSPERDARRPREQRDRREYRDEDDWERHRRRRRPDELADANGPDAKRRPSPSSPGERRSRRGDEISFPGDADYQLSSSLAGGGGGNGGNGGNGGGGRRGEERGEGRRSSPDRVASMIDPTGYGELRDTLDELKRSLAAIRDLGLLARANAGGDGVGADADANAGGDGDNAAADAQRQRQQEPRQKRPPSPEDAQRDVKRRPNAAGGAANKGGQGGERPTPPPQQQQRREDEKMMAVDGERAKAEENGERKDAGSGDGVEAAAAALKRAMRQTRAVAGPSTPPLAAATAATAGPSGCRPARGGGVGGGGGGVPAPSLLTVNASCDPVEEGRPTDLLSVNRRMFVTALGKLD